MKTPSQQASVRLQETGRAKDTAQRFAWSLLITATVLEVVLCVALMDYWLMLSRPLRAAGFVLLLSLLGLGLGGWLRLRRRPTTIKEAALDTEAQRPELGCVVSTAAEYLSGERKVTHEYEPELVAALEQQAARGLARVQVSYSKRLQRPGAFFAFALLTVLIFAAAAPVALTALKRTVAPWSQETYTKIEVQPGSIEVPVGRDVTLTNKFTGRMPKDPRLQWRETDQTSWQTVALAKGEDGSYQHSFRQLEKAVQYRVAANDAVSETFEIATYVPPEVRELRIRVAYPDYTGVKPFAPESPNFTVLRASDVGFRITATAKLASARLRFTNAPPVDLTPSENDSWVGGFKPVKDTDYWIELADAKGHRGGNEQPYHVKVLPDRPPKVAVVEPGQDIRADATNTIPLKVAATDDFGISELKIVYHKLGGPEQTLICARTNGAGREVIGTAQLDLSRLDLKDHELVAYHAEALDNNTLDGPGKGSSPVYFIEITHLDSGQCQSKQSGERVNLLTIQKQIVADTAALRANAAPDKFKELAERQREATEFAQIYRDSMGEAGAPSEATELMQDAMKQMQSASGSLGDRKRDQAIPPEEKALADMYQIVKLMPELGNMPTQPQEGQEQQQQKKALKVVLDAIQKQKKEPPSNEEIAEALDDAKQLSRSQAAINQAVDRPGQESQGQSPSGQPSSAASQAESEQQSQASKADGKSGDQQQAQQASANGKPGEGKESQQAKAGDKSDSEQQSAQAKSGSQPGQGKGKGEQGEQAEQKPGDGAGAGDMEKLAEMQEQLSKEAAALSDKLEKLAGKDTRLGHNTSQRASQASGKMAAAAKAMRQGNGRTAGTEGAQGYQQLDKVIASLERILKDQAKLTDAAAEEAPKEYEPVISDYFRKLSHEK